MITSKHHEELTRIAKMSVLERIQYEKDKEYKRTFVEVMRLRRWVAAGDADAMSNWLGCGFLVDNIDRERHEFCSEMIPYNATWLAGVMYNLNWHSQRVLEKEVIKLMARNREFMRKVIRVIRERSLWYGYNNMRELNDKLRIFERRCALPV